MFGTGEKFDLTHAVYCREGSAFFLIENWYSHLLQLSSYKPGAWMDSNAFLFSLLASDGQRQLDYTYHGDPGSITLTTMKGQIEIIFTYNEYARVISHDGLCLSLRADPYKPQTHLNAAGACHGACTLPDGTTEVTYGTYGKLRFRPLKGKVELEWGFDAKGTMNALSIKMLPDESGELDFAIHEAMIEFESLPETYPDPAELRQDGFDRYESFVNRVYLPPAKGYEQLYKYATHTSWARRTKPGAGGIYEHPMMLMHYEYLGEAFAWQQSYHAMSMLNDPEEAWRMICVLFDHQNPVTGQLPGNVGFLTRNAGIQPPIQGFALDWLIDKCGDSFLTEEECARMFPKFAKWVDFWVTYRSAGRGDDVTMIDSPNDSGWDDATIFKDGFPTINPDLMAFMIDLLEMTGRLAEGCGKKEEAASYKARSQQLLQTLLDEFWDGDKFVTLHNGKPVDSLSIASYQPILLGKRLPQKIIDRIAEQLTEEGNFLTDIGLASESLRSTDVNYGTSTFVHGRVVAPVQLFMCAGLNLAGKKKEAAMIARRFCNVSQEKGCILGFPPLTDKYAATGKPIYIAPGPVASDGWPWSGWNSCNCLTLMTCIIPEGENA